MKHADAPPAHATRPFIVVSGLPASGKSTLATSLAHALDLPLYDKDDILETLFESFGQGGGSVDLAARQTLSRASDQVLMRLARDACGAVLVSFWRHPCGARASGTPCDWVSALSPLIIEVHCRCGPETAAARFQSRMRHAGHHDEIRSAQELRSQFSELAALGPLGFDPLIIVDTSTRPNLAALVGEIRSHLEKAEANPPTP